MTDDITKKYQRLSPIEHILKRPGMYIGGVDEVIGDVWLLQDNLIKERSISYSPGLYKIFDELIVNAYDQYVRDKTLKTIKINISKEANIVKKNHLGSFLHPQLCAPPQQSSPLPQPQTPVFEGKKPAILSINLSKKPIHTMKGEKG